MQIPTERISLFWPNNREKNRGVLQRFSNIRVNSFVYWKLAAGRWQPSVK
jgi:hypothetical protein